MNNLYEISISLQLSGALLLLLWSFSKMSTNVLNMCFPGVVFAKRKENGDLYIEKAIIKRKVETILLNVCAFVFIAAGYLYSIFAENDLNNPMDKCCTIVLLTVLFLIAACVISKCIAAACAKKDHILTEEEIEKYNIPTYMTEQEVSDLFSE